MQILQNKLTGARRTLATIFDPLLISRIYDFMRAENVEMTSKEQTHYRILKLKINPAQMEMGGGQFEPQTNEKLFLKSIENDDVRALIKILHEIGDSMTKEDIVIKLFGLDYDPVIHDSKLYKLILRARKDLNSDLILNHYGKYSLNLKKYRIIA